MRIAIVSPYSWTYSGGVNRHVESLADHLVARGHELRVLAPWDPADRLSQVLHRAPAADRRRPEWLVPLGRTVGFGANGSVSNLSVSPSAVTAMRRELRAFAPDVVHVHEPPAPLVSWDACSWRGAPVVGTFHAYSTKPLPNHAASMLGARRKFNQLSGRIAVSQAAAWTGRRWFGGEYEVIPNGVDTRAAPSGPKPESEELRILFIGRAEERKGLPVLLTAFSALAEHVPARLTVVGPDAEDVHRYLGDADAERRIDTPGRVSGAELWHHLHEADVLSAPSLEGESFGMVLTEAFAAGTPVVASNIAGYSDVVGDEVDGLLVPPADPQSLAEALQRLHHEPERRRQMGREARRSAERYSWERVAARVEGAYERATEVPGPADRREAIGRRIGMLPSDGGPRIPARRLERPEPEPARARGLSRLKRRAALGVAALLGIGLTAIAAQRVGLDAVVGSIVRSDVSWVLIATALMVAAFLMRATSWVWILRSALPNASIRRRDVTSAAMVGVLMSATLPARLGEPARAMVLSRRTGRMRETFSVVLGTMISQTVLNVIALVALGMIVVSATELFHRNTEQIFLFSLVPLALLLGVLLAPFVVRSAGNGRASRAISALSRALLNVRSGMRVFRDPRYGPPAAAAQLLSWALQLAACWALLEALGIQTGASVAAAAGVLFAVNVTAVVPATPSNIGVFQLATVSVLTTGFGVSAADALAYGVILQAVEFATAVALGVPALVREGVTWSDMRMRAVSAAPVRLRPWTRREPEHVGYLPVRR